MKILRFPQLKAEKGIDYSRMHVDRLEKAGKFPKRVKLGENSVGWIESEIDAWLKARADARFADAVPAPADGSHEARHAAAD
jgi:prophage regulatory protein